MSRRSIARGVLAAFLLALVVPAGAGAVSLPAGTTAVLSGTPDLLGLLATPVAASSSSRDAVDDEGDRIVFASDSDGLVADDDDDVTNVYVKDVATGVVELVSRSSDGEPSHGDCFTGSISGDGRKVAFVCDDPLDPADDNDLRDVYVRDLAPGAETTTFVSRASDGSAGDGDSEQPVLDGAGASVAFTSRASNLVALPVGTPQVARVFRRDLADLAAPMTLVSADSNGVANTIAATEPSISDDGLKVAFTTRQSLTVDDTNIFFDVYVRSINLIVPGASTTILASVSDGVSAVPVAGDDSSFNGAISGDGLSVAFASLATNLDVPNVDGDHGADVYVHRFDLPGTTRLLSVTSAGMKGNSGSFTPSINEDGSLVGFASFATNLDPADGSSGLDGYVARSGGLRLVSRGSGVGGAVSNDASNMAVSGDGSVAVMTAGGSIVGAVDPSVSVVVRRDIEDLVTTLVSRPAGTAPFVNAGGDSEGGSVSGDGRFVAFTTTAPALGGVGGIQPVVVRDVVTGGVTVVSREDGPDGKVLSGRDARISANGRRVAFVVDDAGLSQVFVRDIASARTIRVSVADGFGDIQGDDFSFAPSISDDGSRVAFVSEARNLDEADDDDQADVHLREIDAGTTLLVDRADGATGAKSSSSIGEAVLSGDGRHVVFETDANNLLDSDRDDVSDVYVRDVEAGRTVLASVNDEGIKGNFGSGETLSISRDGNRVSFFSRALNLAAAIPQLYVRDISARTLRIAARADGLNGNVIDGDVDDAALSADGQHLVFVADPAASIAPGAPGDGAERVFERDLASGATRLISRRSGVAGAPLDASGVSLGGVSADGGCVAFSTAGRLLPGLVSADFANVYLRAVTTECGRPVPSSPPPPGGRSGPAVLSGLAVRPARFHVGGRRAGTRISFRLDRASGVTLTFERLLAGHRKGKRCSTRVRRGRRCTVARRVGRLTLKQSRLRAGANTVRFSGKLGRKALVPGRYRLTATPAGGKGRAVRFVVVKAPKRASTKRTAHR